MKDGLRCELLRDGKFALGITVGATVALFAFLWFDFFNLGISQDTTLIGAIVGGFLAGLTSLLATILSNYFAIQDATARRKESDEAVAASCFQKLHSSRDTLIKAYRHYLDGSPDNVISYGRLDEPQRSIPKPLAFSRIERRFNDAELSLAFIIKEADFFNLMGEVDNFVSNYNSLSDSYAVQFNRFQAILLGDPAANYSGRHISSTEVTIHPVDILAVEDLRNLLVDCVSKGSALISEAHEAMISIMDKHFGRKIEFIVDAEMPGHVVVEQDVEAKVD